MRKFTKRAGMAIAAAAACVLAPVSASAAVIDFSNISSNGNPIGPFSVDGLNISVSADSFVVIAGQMYLLNNADAEVTVDGEGLGVHDGSRIEQDDVDGLLGNDILIFDFGREVSLNEIQFENVANGILTNDNFVFFVADTLAELGAGLAFASMDIVGLPGDEGEFTFDPGVVGRYFGIGARGLNDNFRVEMIDAHAVPLPAALPMMALGLGALGVATRRKRATA